MIRSFRHKGLKRLYERGDSSGVSSALATKLRIILADLDAATSAQDLRLPGYAMHPLKGARKGFWAVKVNANWRVTFRFIEEEPDQVDLTDYH